MLTQERLCLCRAAWATQGSCVGTILRQLRAPTSRVCFPQPLRSRPHPFLPSPFPFIPVFQLTNAFT